ncbi:crustacean CHH/MIH/GIH neurohormone family domain-containing protein [Ditylenchus destructor]|nr:crustacean CHH/MIH/GIH neurohormone family domain-containing protein [Ditylenchus destructor]
MLPSSGSTTLISYVILLLCLSILPAAMANSLDNLSQDDAMAIVVSETDESAPAKWRFDPKSCNIYENEPLHAIMDRVCELCHDMYSHQNPNMRMECRSDCFRSENFEKCLRLFKPSRALRARNQNRTRRL